MKRMIVKAASDGSLRQKNIEAFLIDYMLDNDYDVDGQPLRSVIIRLMNMRHDTDLNEIRDTMYEEGLTLTEALDLIESQIGR